MSALRLNSCEKSILVLTLVVIVNLYLQLYQSHIIGNAKSIKLKRRYEALPFGLSRIIPRQEKAQTVQTTRSYFIHLEKTSDDNESVEQSKSYRYWNSPAVKSTEKYNGRTRTIISRRRLKSKPVRYRKHKKAIDPFETGPFNFLPRYKNPCFLQNVTIGNATTEKLRCLPYFMIVGMPKCGTTDLWYVIKRHMDVCLRHNKEPMWYNRLRFGANSFNEYLDIFGLSTKCISAKMKKFVNLSDHSNRTKTNKFITGEASVDYSFDNNHWTSFSGNENSTEPKVLNQHHIRHIYPGTKLIFMMRNPVDRLYSDYLFESTVLGYTKSTEDFHKHVISAIENHRDCRKSFSLRACAYNHSLETYKARLRVGMYHVFTEDWMRVFPKENILFLKFEEYSRNTTREVARVFQHLGLRPFTHEELLELSRRKIQNTRSKENKELGDMLSKTRKALRKFYEPFNKRLANSLKNDKWLW